jgi:hypothetical protein
LPRRRVKAWSDRITIEPSGAPAAAIRADGLLDGTGTVNGASGAAPAAGPASMGTTVTAKGATAAKSPILRRPMSQAD